jgi:3-oxoacyl-[acyl-carrier-protein] synthase II
VSVGVVITGRGAATCMGLSAHALWRGVAESRPALGPLTAMDLPPGQPLLPAMEGGQCPDLPPDFAPGLPREARYLRWVALEALRDAGLLDAHGRAAGGMRGRVILGTTLHGIRAGGEYLLRDDPGALRAFLAGATAHLALRGLGLHAGCATTCSACSSSLGAIALGVSALRTGQADYVLAGGYDPVSLYAWAGFNALRVVTSGPLRPFARGRTGMKLAEGYGLVVIERAPDARARGVRAHAVIAGWGESADAHHLTQPHPQGEGALRAAAEALARAGDAGTLPDLICAHATGTPDNDRAEAQAIGALLGPRAGQVPVVGLKSHLGHTLGGAGAVELIVAMSAIEHQVAPACAGLQDADVEYETLGVRTGPARPAHIARTLNLSLGFGGANTAMVLHAPALSSSTTSASAHDQPGAPRRAAITGTGVVLPGIVGTDAYLHALREGRDVTGGTIDEAGLGGVINLRRARRLSPYVKLSLAASALALRDAGAEGDAAFAHDLQVLLATAHGSPSLCYEYYQQIVRTGEGAGVLGANPVAFAEGVPNAAAAHVSATLGIKGVCQTIIGARTAGLDALSMAVQRVIDGTAGAVLVTAAEETHHSTDRAYRHFGLQAHEGAPRERDTPAGPHAPFVPTPGAAALLVEDEARARARGARILGFIQPGTMWCGQPAHLARGVRAALVGAGEAHIITTCPGTWLARAEQRELQGRRTSHAAAGVGECFSVLGPLGAIRALTAHTPGAEASAILATDWTGCASMVLVRGHRGAARAAVVEGAGAQGG